MALAPGSYSVGGVAYNYRSASTTADAGLAAGAKAYTITSTDNEAYVFTLLSAVFIGMAIHAHH